MDCKVLIPLFEIYLMYRCIYIYIYVCVYRKHINLPEPQIRNYVHEILECED